MLDAFLCDCLPHQLLFFLPVDIAERPGAFNRFDDHLSPVYQKISFGVTHHKHKPHVGVEPANLTVTGRLHCHLCLCGDPLGYQIRPEDVAESTADLDFCPNSTHSDGWRYDCKPMPSHMKVSKLSGMVRYESGQPCPSGFDFGP